MKRLFTDMKMTWKRVILFALITGIYAGLVMSIPFLKETSFQDIGIEYEWWVIFAVIIVVNCEKNWEAMLKCFVFFVISQPIIYLVEIVFGAITVEKAWYSYYYIWLRMTFLTLPGGFIAYYCKKQNVLGAVILGFGNTIQAVMGAAYTGMAFRNFPYHILSALVSFGSIIVMSMCIQEEKKNRMIAMLLPVVLLAVLLVFLKMDGRVLF